MAVFPLTQVRKNKRISLAAFQKESFCNKKVTFNRTHVQEEFQGSLLSLSPSGMFIKTYDFPEKGDLIFVNFHFYRKQIKLLARVIYVNRVGDGFRPQGIGVKFLRMNEDDYADIVKAIDYFCHKFQGGKN